MSFSSAVSRGVLLGIAFLSLPLPFALADETKPVPSSGWFHAARTLADGQKMEIWVSHEHQIYALVSEYSVQLINGRQRTKYEAVFRSKKLTKYPVSADWSPPPARADGAAGLGHWLYGLEQINHQRRTEVTSGGKKWIEYHATMYFGSAQWIVRVDPETGMVVSTRGGKRGADEPPAYVFETLAEGPRDVYGCGFPREAEVIDLSPSPELNKVLEGMAASRTLLGDYRMYLNEDEVETLVWRKGERWRVDSLQETQLDWSKQPPPGPERERWWDEQLAGRTGRRQYVCDGLQVFGNMSFGARGKPPLWRQDKSYGVLDVGASYSLLRRAYPDLAPQRGYKTELVLKPDSGPKGCVLYKRSAAHTGGARGNGWYYLDPARGYCVVRLEQFESGLMDLDAKPQASPKLHTVTFDGYERSPRGFWYPTYCQTEDGELDPATGDRLPKRTENVRYHFDFPADIPDSLFAVEPPPEEKP